MRERQDVVGRREKNEELHLSLSICPPRLAFLAWGDFHARSRFARSTIPEEKWGLLVVYRNRAEITEFLCVNISPIRYWFRARAKAIRTYISVNIAQWKRAGPITC